MLVQTSIPILEKLQDLSSAGNFNLIEDLGIYISAIVGLILTIAGVATLGYLVLGGINWLTAGHDKNKIDEARSRITNAIIGLAIVACAWAIFLILDNFFGLGIAGGSGGGGGGGGGGGWTPPPPAPTPV